MYEKFIDNERPINTVTDKQLLSQIHSLENQLAMLTEENNKLKKKIKRNEDN